MSSNDPVQPSAPEGALPEVPAEQQAPDLGQGLEAAAEQVSATDFQAEATPADAAPTIGEPAAAGEPTAAPTAFGQSSYAQTPYMQSAVDQGAPAPAFDPQAGYMQAPYDQSAPGQAAYDQAAYGQQPYGQAGAPQAAWTQPAAGQQPVYDPSVQPKSMIAAALLAFFLGALGVHNFYLGNTGKGVAQLLITLLSFGLLSFISWIWSIIEMILILTRSGSYAYDARGVPLAS